MHLLICIRTWHKIVFMSVSMYMYVAWDCIHVYINVYTCKTCMSITCICFVHPCMTCIIMFMLIIHNYASTYKMCIYNSIKCVYLYKLCVYTCTCMYVLICIYVLICMYVLICIYVLIILCMYVLICIYVYLYFLLCVSEWRRSK